jgi:CspA family cold shock protein
VVAETGTVKWLNVQRGYGFTTPDSGSKEVFVHVSALERSSIQGLSEGQTVVVDVLAARKGYGKSRCIGTQILGYNASA